MESLLAVTRKEWPREIIVEPSRLAMPIWGEPEGDIQAAYSADIFPKIRTFIHQGHLFTNCGGCCEHSMNCYPLIPEEAYQGPEPAQYTYEGRSAVHRGQNVRLGPCVKFVIRDRTAEEWADLLQRQYAYGGMFAAGKTYCEMLQNFQQRDRISDGERTAIASELARPDLPATQTEMRERFLGKSAATSSEEPEDLSQFSLPGL